MSDPVTLPELLEHVMAIELAVDGLAHRYRLRPPAATEFPIIYHRFPGPSTHERITTGTSRDTINITSRICVRIDAEREGAGDELLALTQAYIERVDPQLWNDDLPYGINNQKRLGFSDATDEFNGIAVMCMDFQLQFELSHQLR
jgi:hypothetical protein